jgi:putative sugar O-methyltransferase
MYQDFYRDPCAKGLVDWPRNSASTREQFEEAELRNMHNETLNRIGCWRHHTESRYPVSALKSPDIGNPFGAWIEGTFVVTRAEYHHACACRIAELRRADGRVVELGGGYGAMAYYLIRTSTTMQYIDFDLPESLALAAYYLGKAFPNRKLVLCGEEGDGLENVPASAIVLLPPWRMPWLTDKSIDVSFSSHLLCDLHPVAQVRYLAEIARFTKGLLVTCGREDNAFAEVVERHFHVMERRRTAWHLYRDPMAIECEQLLQPLC